MASLLSVTKVYLPWFHTLCTFLLTWLQNWPHQKSSAPRGTAETVWRNFLWESDHSGHHQLPSLSLLGELARLAWWASPGRLVFGQPARLREARVWCLPPAVAQTLPPPPIDAQSHFAGEGSAWYCRAGTESIWERGGGVSRAAVAISRPSRQSVLPLDVLQFLLDGLCGSYSGGLGGGGG